MANLDSLKDPRSIASISALVAVGVSWTYFHNEISKLKEQQTETSKEVTELKKHLSTFILSNPEAGKQLEQVMRAVKILDSRLVETQERIRQTRPLEDGSSKRIYQRLTDRADKPAMRRPEVRRQPEPEVEEDLFDPELEDDIAAMTA